MAIEEDNKTYYAWAWVAGTKSDDIEIPQEQEEQDQDEDVAARLAGTTIATIAIAMIGY